MTTQSKQYIPNNVFYNVLVPHLFCGLPVSQQTVNTDNIRCHQKPNVWSNQIIIAKIKIIYALKFLLLFSLILTLCSVSHVLAFR